MTFRRVFVPLLFVAHSASVSAGMFLQDQSDFSTSKLFGISDNVVAVALAAPSATRLDSVTVWLCDGAANDNGVLDNFGGTLSWAILLDDLGPDTPLFTGADLTPELVDTGIQTPADQDVFRVRIDLDGRPDVQGTAWLAIHEGLWGSASDGTSVSWVSAATQIGGPAMSSSNETNPGPGSWSAVTGDPAFTAEGDAYFWNQGSSDLSNGFEISSFVEAADFSLTQATQISSADVWISDGFIDNDGQLDFFGGAISWAIYSDIKGFPGSLLESGTDTTPIVVDTRTDIIAQYDLAQVRFELASRPLLDPGDYWFVLHEGAWGSPFDGSPVYWSKGSSLIGENYYYSENESSPGNWQFGIVTGDPAFVLFEDELFASGFEAGVACAWSGSTGGTLCP